MPIHIKKYNQYFLVDVRCSIKKHFCKNNSEKRTKEIFIYIPLPGGVEKDFFLHQKYNDK
jgi:hypothetical protein